MMDHRSVTANIVCMCITGLPLPYVPAFGNMLTSFGFIDIGDNESKAEHQDFLGGAVSHSDKQQFGVNCWVLFS